MEKITKDMGIMDIVTSHPETLEVLQNMAWVVSDAQLQDLKI